MAVQVTYTVNIQIVQGGVTLVDRELTEAGQFDAKFEGTYWLDDVTDKVTLCVKGTDLVAGGPSGGGITDPMVVGLTKIRGFAIQTDLDVELRFNSADDVLSVPRGSGGFSKAVADIVEIAKAGADSGEVRFILWGDR